MTGPERPPADRLVDAKEAAHILGISVKSLRRLADVRPVPVPITGKRDRPRWSLLELEATIERWKRRREAS